LISDWNRKYANQTNDVVIMNYGYLSGTYDEVRASIPTENPVLTVDVKQCKSYAKSHEAAFIIIIVTKTKFTSVRNQTLHARSSFLMTLSPLRT
jgi:hypothetical protein